MTRRSLSLAGWIVIGLEVASVGVGLGSSTTADVSIAWNVLVAQAGALGAVALLLGLVASLPARRTR